jgi:cystathionine beta-lyase
VARDTSIISDEIRGDLLFDRRRHVPIASLSPEVARRSIKLMSASMAYNIAGLKTPFAIVQNPELRNHFSASRLSMAGSVNVLGLVATEAAYTGGAEWRTALLADLRGNRNYLGQQVASRLPGVELRTAEGTLLAWLDCSALGLDDPQRFFLEYARMRLSAGVVIAVDLASSGSKIVRRTI